MVSLLWLFILIVPIKRDLHIAAMSSFYDVGICQYSKDNPLGGPWRTQVSTVIGQTDINSIDIDVLIKLVDFLVAKSILF